MQASVFLLGLTMALGPAHSVVVCPSTERLAGGSVQYPEQAVVGSVLTYLCPSGYRPYPVSWRVCLPSGRWSRLRNAFHERSPSAKCVPYVCVAPTYIRNGYFQPRKLSYVVNDTISFECHEGFGLLGSRTRTCLANGRWSGTTTVCDDGDSLCPDPGIPVGGSRRGDSYDEGDVVTYLCFSKLVLRGSATRRCDKTGRWLGTEATCEYPFSYDEPRTVAQRLTLSEEILEHAKQGTHLYFVLDASGSVGEGNFRKTLDFVEAFSEMTSDLTARMKYFVLVFASEVLYETRSAVSPIYEDFFSNLNYRNFDDKMGTNIGGALMKVLESVNQTLGMLNPSQVPRQVIILITDGKQNMGPNPLHVIQMLKEVVPEPDRNLDIFAIGIGDASKRELEDISTKREEPHSYYFSSYNQLEELTNLTKGTLDDVPGCGVRGRSRRRRSLGRVYGGENAEEKQWPWQVRLEINGQSGTALGAGSLVSRSWVMTAAHNMFDAARIVNGSAIIASLGSTQGDKGERRKVSEVHVHPEYNNEEASQNANYAYDIALIKLENPVTFNSTMAPVCLPCTEEMANYLPAPEAAWESQCTYQDRILTGYGGLEWREITGYISGWGLTEKRRLSNILQHGRISIKHRTQCMKNDLDQSLFCAKGDGVDACQGDSGGPFTIKIKQRWIQIGIVSSGSATSCHGDNMGYYTNVVRMMDWVRQKVNDLQFE